VLRSKRRVEARSSEVLEGIYTVDPGRSLTVRSSQEKKVRHVVKSRSQPSDLRASGCEPWISQPFRIRHLGETRCAKMNPSKSEARSPEVTWHDDVTQMMWTSLVPPRVSQNGTLTTLLAKRNLTCGAMCHHLNC
jgi:hypothetical protein